MANRAVGRDAVGDGALLRFEIFLFVSIATVLVTRGLLAAAGYPQVGTGELHIAHVLWGGLLLGVAVVILLIGMGPKRGPGRPSSRASGSACSLMNWANS